MTQINLNVVIAAAGVLAAMVIGVLITVMVHVGHEPPPSGPPRAQTVCTWSPSYGYDCAVVR